MTRVSLEHVNSADKAAFVAALGDIFEHAPWVAEQAYARRPFLTLASLYDIMIGAVKQAPREQQLAFINGHPDLAGKAALPGTMTADSKAEQGSIGLDRLSNEEFQTFHRLNVAY